MAQELCAGQGRGRHGVQPYYLRPGPAVLLRLPSPQPGLPEPSVRVLSVEFLLCGLHASVFPTSCFKTELLGAGGKADEHFLFICLSGGPPLAMPSPPFHPKNEYTLRGSCVTKALGTVASTHPAQRGCALTFLVPPVPKTRLQNCILGSATSWPPSPPLLPRAGALTISSREGQLLIWGVKQGAKTNQPPGPGTGGEAEEARDVGEAPCHPLSPCP